MGVFWGLCLWWCAKISLNLFAKHMYKQQQEQPFSTEAAAAAVIAIGATTKTRIRSNKNSSNNSSSSCMLLKNQNKNSPNVQSNVVPKHSLVNWLHFVDGFHPSGYHNWCVLPFLRLLFLFSLNGSSLWHGTFELFFHFTSTVLCFCSQHSSNHYGVHRIL